jgi:hypothetical protein
MITLEAVQMCMAEDESVIAFLLRYDYFDEENMHIRYRRTLYRGMKMCYDGYSSIVLAGSLVVSGESFASRE